MAEGLVEQSQPAGAALSVAARHRSLADLLRYDKTRLLLGCWVPFCIVWGTLGVILEPNPLVIVAAIVVGIFVYSFIEYLAHRYVLHAEPENRILRLITMDAGRGHLRHHRDPGHYGGAINGAQPPIVVFGCLLALLAWAVPFFPTGFGFIAIAAGGANYAAQELVHYCTHHMPMRGGFIGRIQRHHMLHHYRDGRSNYGLFWTFWDPVFGTSYRQESGRQSKG
jgi:sterol desaturase/sphingolipid hydroxylase (fatty acid hydroxylase superfamily)